MKYYAKILPVEGTPVKGDIVMNENDDTCCLYDDEPKYGLSTISESIFMHIKNPRKANVFLCTQHIGAGDVLKECLPDNQPQTVHHFESVLPYGVFVFEPWPSDNEKFIRADKAFKVVGLISPKAIFVKNGDQFDESDINVISYWTPGQTGLIEVKCSNCKTYH